MDECPVADEFQCGVDLTNIAIHSDWGAFVDATD
jgi:hypothetical protein